MAAAAPATAPLARVLVIVRILSTISKAVRDFAAAGYSAIQQAR